MSCCRIKFIFHADEQIFKDLLLHYIQGENRLLPKWADMYLNPARRRKVVMSQGATFEGLNFVIVEVVSEEIVTMLHTRIGPLKTN